MLNWQRSGNTLHVLTKPNLAQGHLYKPGMFCEGKEAARGKPECMGGEYMRM